MARQLVRGLCFVALAAALVFQGCGKSPPSSLDRKLHPVAARAAAVDPPASPSAAHGRWKTSERLPVASAPLEQYPTEDPSPWLAELLHATDPNVRIQALDAWARQPGASLDPVTYALVDPDESVRARAQELWEQKLARR
jgi:hypothetical protein